MPKTNTRLLVIAITTTAIIAAATTTSLSAATPAFARLNCNEDLSICTGGTSHDDIPGGQGVRIVNEESSFSSSGGLGQNAGAGGLVGGRGSHTVCDASGCSDPVGGSGLHPKGPGGNSGNAPPP